MKLTVRNVARISLAEIVLDGVTVVSGSNGTGKSTISRSLMTMASVSGNISELVQLERVNSIFHALRKSFVKHGADILYPPHFIRDRKNDWSKWLSKDWWSNNERIINWIKGDDRLLVFPDDFLSGDGILSVVSDARPDILSILDRPESEYVDFICKKSMAKAFNGQIKPVFSDSDVESEIKLEDGAEISFKFLNGEIHGISGIGRSFSPSTIYIEPLNFVDFVNSTGRGIQDRYTARRFCVCNAITQKPSDSGLSFEEARELNEAKSIVDRIVRIIRGHLVDNSNSDICFSERFSDDKARFMDVQNIASGMKTMAAIVRMAENRSIRRGSLLIVDEPETNLHPDWQVKFAVFLVLLSRDLGVRLLVNTHSPYFLQALWKYTKRLGVKSNFYNMVQGGAPDSFASDDISSNIDCVFRTMSEPFNNLIGE